MEIWLDTTDKSSIKTAKEMGVLHGVTTNPSIISKSGKSLEKVLEDILHEQSGPVTAQVTTYESSSMIKQALKLVSFSKRIIVKIPATQEGYKAIHELSKQKVPIMATCVFHPNQVLLACKAGAPYIAPYYSRLNDSGEDAQTVLKEMMELIIQYQFPTKLLAASLRNAEQVRQCMDMGIHAATLNALVFKEFIADNSLTIKNIERFANDWENAEPSTLLSEKAAFMPQS